jgi:metallophosphoesterase superfamily enzyme
MYYPAILQRQKTSVFSDPASSKVLLCGKSFLADPTGALFWPAENALIVADLNLSEGSYLEGEDVVLPPYDTASAFEKLEEAIDRYNPERVIALGNSFGAGGLNAHRSDWLSEMTEDREWYWVSAAEKAVPEGVAGTVVPQLVASGIKFRGEAVRAPVANEIAGGLHPIAQISQYGHAVCGRCFVTNGMRLIMPSRGNYAAGMNVLSAEFDPLLGQAGLFVWFITGGRVYPVASAQLIEERAA